MAEDCSAARSYRKKPVVIEARQFTGENGREIEAWADSWHEGSVGVVSEMHAPTVLAVYTLEGVMKVDAGDWIIRGVKGEFYPCKPDIFEETYESCDQPDRLREALTYYAEGRYPDGGEIAREALGDG